ncbi:hypothetical protein ACFWYW_50810 [Nonomuraea sp. NPDC059023]
MPHRHVRAGGLAGVGARVGEHAWDVAPWQVAAVARAPMGALGPAAAL